MTTYAQAETYIIDAIEGTTPSDTKQGGSSFEHVEDLTIEKYANDRHFVMLIEQPPQLHGQVSTTTPRYSTGVRASFLYHPRETLRATLLAIAADAPLLQVAIADDHRIQLEGEGEDLFSAGLEDLDEGAFLFNLSFTIHHT